MRVQKSELLAAMELPSACGVARVLPIAGHLRMGATNGVLRIAGTDGNQSGECDCPCDEDIDPFLVNSKSLYRAIEFGGNEIELTIPKEGQLEIRNGSKTTLPTLPASEFPNVFPEKCTAIGVNCEDLAIGIKSVGWCVYTREDRPNLCGTHVLGTPSMLICEACDGAQLARYEQPAIEATCEFIIPTAFQRMLTIALMKPEAILMLSQNHARVQFETGMYECKLMDQIYVSTQVVLNQERQSLGVISRDEWLNMMHYIHTSGATEADRMGIKPTLEFGPKGCMVDYDSGAAFTFSKTVLGKFKKLKATVNAGSFTASLNAFPAGANLNFHHTFNSFVMDHDTLTVVMQAVGKLE